MICREVVKLIELDKVCEGLQIDEKEAKEFINSLLKSYIFSISIWRARHLTSEAIRKHWPNISKLKDPDNCFYAEIDNSLAQRFVAEILQAERTYKKGIKCYLWSRHVNCYFEIASMVPYILKLDEQEINHCKEVSERMNRAINKQHYKLAWRFAGIAVIALFGKKLLSKKDNNSDEKTS